MLHKITIGDKTFYYDPEYRALFEDEKRERIVQTKWFKDEELREYYRLTGLIHDKFKKDVEENS